MFHFEKKLFIYTLICLLVLPSFIEFLRINYALSQTGGNVSVTATVPQILTCTLSSNTTNFGAIDHNSVYTSSPNITLTMSCNVAGGCTSYVKDQGSGTQPGLYNSTANYLIPSPAAGFPQTATLVAGTEGYGIQAATTTAGQGGILSINSRYNQTGNTVGGLTLTETTLAASTQPINNREVVITHKAAVSILTPQGNYSDTITYSCTGN